MGQPGQIYKSSVEVEQKCKEVIENEYIRIQIMIIHSIQEVIKAKCR